MYLKVELEEGLPLTEVLYKLILMIIEIVQVRPLKRVMTGDTSISTAVRSLPYHTAMVPASAATTSLEFVSMVVM